MKNILVYYLAILIPIALLFWIVKAGNTGWFAVLILIYALPYRWITDGYRLVVKGKMTWSETWKLFIPWLRFNYTRELYFKK